MDEHCNALEQIVKRIKGDGPPAFIKSAQRIAQLTENNETDIKELCSVIIKDPGMATRILRASNQSFNVRRGRSNTVSRAVVMLGVQEVRSICLASEVVDGLTKSSNVRPELIHELIRTFFAAVQARHLAIQNRDRYSEEVFTATLVKRLGRIVFWKSNSPLVDKLAEAFKNPVERPEIIEKRILGFTLDELSEKVIELWELDKLVTSAQQEDSNNCLRSKEIYYSNALATASICGWNSSVVVDLLEEMSESLNIEQKEIQKIMTRTAKEACETAISFGLEEATKAIPEVLSDEELFKEREKLVKEFEFLEPDPMVQLETFKKLPGLISKSSDLRLIIFEIMEGMTRGLGLDRVVFSLVNTEHTMLSARLISSPDYALLMKKFKFPINNNSDSFFGKSYIEAKAMWFSPEEEDYQSMLSEEFKLLFGEIEFFIAPIILEDNFIACFYGDRAISKRELNQDVFNTFSQLALQGQFAMERKG